MLSGSPTKLVSKTTSRKENPSPPTLPQHNQRLDIQPDVRLSPQAAQASPGGDSGLNDCAAASASAVLASAAGVREAGVVTVR
jgi:hypothetical protein